VGIYSAKIRSRTSSISSSVITSSSRSERCHHLPGLREKTLCIQRCGACSTMASPSCKRYHLISPGFTPTGLLLQFTMYTISRAAFCCSRLHYELHLHSIAMSCTKSPSHNSVVPVANSCRCGDDSTNFGFFSIDRNRTRKCHCRSSCATSSTYDRCFFYCSRAASLVCIRWSLQISRLSKQEAL
jgi:hypothetical protein